MSVEVQSEDVVKLMMQFCRENGLNSSLKALQAETNVQMNGVENVEALCSDIRNGRWESVLSQVSGMSLPRDKLVMLYEQVVFELLEGGEKEMASTILEVAEPLATLKVDQIERWRKLDQLCNRGLSWNPTIAYEMGSSKDKRRAELAAQLSSEMSCVPSGRLLALLGQALKHQQIEGLLPHGASLDLFAGAKRAAARDADEKIVGTLSAQVKISPEAHPESAAFSPDGLSLVLGSVDGFVEIWDPDSCKLRTDLEYQQGEDPELMMHDDPVLCSAFSRDGEFLVTGCQAGQVKVWKLKTGALLRKFPKAHPEGITSVSFSADGTQILSTSFDCSVRLHGIRSGKMLKEFRGHTSYVNAACFSQSGDVFSSASDGTIKHWDAKSTDCLRTIRPGVDPSSGGGLKEEAVHTLQMLPGGVTGQAELIFACTKSCRAYLLTMQGDTVATLSSGKLEGGDFVCATVSPRGKWVYCAGEDGVVYVFSVHSGQLELALPASDKEIIGIAHHPLRNRLITYTDDGALKLWQA